MRADVAVIGAGRIGHALALVFALGGPRVRLTDNNTETLVRAPGLMATALGALAEVDAGRDRRWLSTAVRCVPSLADTVKGASIEGEVVAERPDVKRTLSDPLQSLIQRHGQDDNHQDGQERKLKGRIEQIARLPRQQDNRRSRQRVRPNRSAKDQLADERDVQHDHRARY